MQLKPFNKINLFSSKGFSGKQCEWIAIPSLPFGGWKKSQINNIDTDNPIIFEPPSGINITGIRFGQGVAIKRGVAIIGAPKSDIHGNIFKCTFDGKTTNSTPTCKKLEGLCFFQCLNSKDIFRD